ARAPGVVYTVLVPNVRGAERALSCGVDEVNLVMSMSESHNRANLRMTREQSFAQLRDVIDAVRGTGVA
ncbi:hydroxymethylglutaryl-CoA lyase, partial [Burkholderia cenocepacia]|nr:hydroxymethylglutaryl-CoA lyase [Burkholderia cenocepacia]